MKQSKRPQNQYHDAADGSVETDCREEHDTLHALVMRRQTSTRTRRLMDDV